MRGHYVSREESWNTPRRSSVSGTPIPVPWRLSTPGRGRWRNAAVGKRLVNGLQPQAPMSGLGGSRERLPVMRKQFLDSVDRVLRGAREHITEPGERLNSKAPAHRDEAQQHGRRLAAPIAAEERPVPTTNGDVPI